jgi:periplasmic protein TonB
MAPIPSIDTHPQPDAALPPLSRRGAAVDILSATQRRAMIAAMVAGHVALAWGLLQVREVREAVADASPLFVSLVTPSPSVPTPAPVPRPPVKTPPPRPIPSIVAAPAKRADPAPFVVPAAPVSTAPPAPPVEQAPTPPSPPSPPSPPVAAQIIPASAVQYLEPPRLVYPRASRRAGEAGRVVLRVYIDEAGMPRQVMLNQSSGFPRLDEAASAAVHAARFKPYSDNGRPLAGWALVPLSFDLEK